MSFREIKEMTESDILNMIENLRKQGIRISVIFGADDKVLSEREAQEKLKGKHVDGFYVVKGGHAEIILHPEQNMGLVDSALDASEKKDSK